MEMTNRLHLYTGEGKGKTTCSMGLALRSLGYNRKVLIAQFVKTGRSGELAALRQFENAHVFAATPIKKFTFKMTPAEMQLTKAQQAADLARLCEIVERERPQLMVFDELAMAVHLGIVEEADMWKLINLGLESGEVAVTGRYAPASLKERADYVSEIVKRKHPYDLGLHARKGVEF